MQIGHVQVRATMLGALMSMPARGKSSTWQEIHMTRIRDGKLLEQWAVQDQLGMLQQLGFAPAPPGSPATSDRGGWAP